MSYHKLFQKGLSLSNGSSGGVSISIKIKNDKGDHLKDCSVVLLELTKYSEVFKKDAYIFHSSMSIKGDYYLGWKAPQKSQKVEIRDGLFGEIEIGSVIHDSPKLAKLACKVVNENDDCVYYPDGNSEAKFLFSANTLMGETISYRFWVSINWDGSNYTILKIV